MSGGLGLRIVGFALPLLAILEFPNEESHVGGNCIYRRLVERSAMFHHQCRRPYPTRALCEWLVNLEDTEDVDFLTPSSVPYTRLWPDPL